MQDQKIINYLSDVLENMPTDWLNLTTHRLDIYEEKLAKVQFLDQFENLFKSNNSSTLALKELPTAYDYIRLGHPLSSILEWFIAKSYGISSENVISFSSKTIPVFAILRKNLLENRNTQILFKETLPNNFDEKILKDIYGYQFELKKIDNIEFVSEFDGSTIYISNEDHLTNSKLSSNVDFFISIYKDLGSVLRVIGKQNEVYVSEIQHVRRRETIAMTPINCLALLEATVNQIPTGKPSFNTKQNKAKVLQTIKDITVTNSEPIVGSSGLSIQYAIMMGLIDDAFENHPGKSIKFIVPPNCYGGTNDQARRVAECNDNVEILDLPVDGNNDMVTSINTILDITANEDAVPFIIAEIPTNPRVEVPDLNQLKLALSKVRKTPSGKTAIDPVFILDQTFCPNVHFLGKGEILSTVRAISYASGSKFPSGGKCTAGYCVANDKAKSLVSKIQLHLNLCDNEATNLQYEILATQMPSMNQRISDAYINTRDFVNFIEETLPEAKINFVTETLANEGFTPSVFSLDLPTKGDTVEDKEAYKRALNHKLIKLMITEIPDESKYCVSYGQLKGCYWTIPATSTQGTTKEGDKDYIARVSLSANMDLELHKKVFSDFVKSI